MLLLPIIFGGFIACPGKCVDDGLVDLYLMGLYPFEGAWQGGQGALISATIALEQINSRPKILPGYRLNLVWFNTKCNEGDSMKGMYESLYTPPVKVMIHGAGCSIVSETIAQAAYLWNIVMMSYASTSPSLSDKTRFPRFYRVMTPGSAVNDVRVKLFHEFGWYKISTIHEAYGLFSSVTDSMLEKLKLTNISVIRSEIFKGDPTIQLHNLKKHDARIIVAGFYEDKAMVVFCEVYKIGLYGPRIVWMLPDWFDSDWWLQRENPTSCTREQLSTALDGYFATGLFYLNPRNVRTVSGIHPQEYYREFKRRANYTKLPGEILSPLSYDAMWGIALALNETIKSLEEIGSAKRLEDFTYEDKEIADLIFNCVRKVHFQGVKGSISFDEDGAAGIVRIQRVQDNELKLVGMFDTGMDNASFEWSSKTPLKWADGKPPKDSAHVKEIKLTVSTVMYIVMCSLAFGGIVLALSFLIFNVTQRNVRIIRMSSPNLNNVILLGCIIGYTTIFLDSAAWRKKDYYCTVQTFLKAFGFSLVYGALFAKTWRVHIICTNVKLKRKALKDIYLYFMVFTLVAIDATVVILWETTDPVHVHIVHLPEKVFKEEDVVLKQYLEQCVSDKREIFLGVLYSVKGILVLLGAALAWETRKVKIPELNDSKFIGVSIYSVVILCVVGVPVSLILDSVPNISFTMESAFIIFGVTITQCVIFVPKVIRYREMKVNPEVEIETIHRTEGRHENKIKHLEEELKKKQSEIEDLTAQLVCGAEATVDGGSENSGTPSRIGFSAEVEK